jgi:hypothetical protein
MRKKGREVKRKEERCDAIFHSKVKFGLAEIQLKYKVVQR